MRLNEPVTTNEYELPDNTFIVSKTDTKGKITWFNDDFVKASGFEPGELKGAPHNIVRHPDMPKQAFADLWASLKAGRPWAGAVKNRRKNGDYYWVFASATPIRENGETTGYMSIRTKLPRDQRPAYDAAYRMFRDGKQGNRRIENGQVKQTTLWSRLNVFTGTIRARLITLVATALVLTVAVGAAGLLTTRAANNRLNEVYQHRAVPIAQIAEINERMLGNVTLLYRGSAETREHGSAEAKTMVAGIAKEIEGNIAAITALWKEYTEGDGNLSPQEKVLAETYAGHRRDFVTKGLNAGRTLLDTGKFEELDKHLSDVVVPLFQTAKKDAEALLKFQIDHAQQEYDASQRDYGMAILIAAVLLGFAILAGAVLGLFTLRAVTRPLARLAGVLQSIALGNYNNVIEIENEDELAEPMRHLRAMQTKMGFDISVQAEANAEKEKRMQGLDALTRAFDAKVTEALGTLASAATELQQTAQSMSATAEQTSRQSTAVAAASEQASTNVQTVASAAEELSSSIAEISRQVSQSTKIAGQAVDEANRTNTEVQTLADAAQKIGDVVKLINDIAGQTNLLALNATIEAARAGEAGKGFAVVASEVKSLANQTAKATEDIAAQVTAIQSATGGAVAAIKRIGTTIAELNEIATTIAAAVEQQGAATQEIARNVQQASRGTGEVSTNIAGVTQAATQTGAAAAQVLGSATALGQQGETLRAEVGKFLHDVKAA